MHSPGGLLDPVFGLRYSSPQQLCGWNYSVEGALKLPVAWVPRFSRPTFDELF